ncbi:MAG: hypothetical protein ACPGLY_12405 [Rubripirellula sp.]
MNALLIQSRFVSPLIFVAFFNLLLLPPIRAAAPGLPQDACQLRWEEQDLCGWISQPHPINQSNTVTQSKSNRPAGYTVPATHDSIAFRIAATAKPAPTTIPTSAAEPASASDTTDDGAITQAAAIAIAAAGISVEQLLEPLALAAPYLDQSLAKVRQYQSWWGAAISTVDQRQVVNSPTSSDIAFAAQLDEIATAEPIDVESYGASVIVDEFPITVQLISEGEPGIEILPLNRLIGSSAVIVTIEEDYMPYDLSTEDIKLWSVLPSSTQPFCIRAEHDAWDAAAMWQAFDDRVVPNLAKAEAQGTAEITPQPTPIPEPIPLFAHCGSADCMLDSIIWHVDSWVISYSKRETGATANQVGHRVVLLSLQQEQLVHSATALIARHWHEPPPVGPEPQETVPATSPAGAALLARAGAIAAEAPVIEVAASTNSLR